MRDIQRYTEVDDFPQFCGLILGQTFPEASEYFSFTGLENFKNHQTVKKYFDFDELGNVQSFPEACPNIIGMGAVQSCSEVEEYLKKYFVYVMKCNGCFELPFQQARMFVIKTFQNFLIDINVQVVNFDLFPLDSCYI